MAGAMMSPFISQHAHQIKKALFYRVMLCIPPTLTAKFHIIKMQTSPIEADEIEALMSGA